MPVLEARLAIQSDRNAGWRREAKALADDMGWAASHVWIDPRSAP
jgi:hypothetical protein